MSYRALFMAVLAASAGVAVAASAATYKIVDRIKVPDGSFDYATFDPATQNIYMPRGLYTTVIKVKDHTVSKLEHAPSDHIALPIPGSPLLLTTQRFGNINLVDPAKDTVVVTLKGGANPNSAVYEPVTKQVFVFNKGDGTATIVDPFGQKVVGVMPVNKATLEFPAADGAGRVFDNIKTTGEIAVIDAKARKVITTYKLKGCEEPSGLVHTGSSGLLISVCGNGVAKVVRAKDGTEVASLPIGHGPDAVIYDAVRKLAFVPCGDEGVLDIISLANLSKIAVIQRVTTLPGSRTGMVDPGSGQVYLMSSKPDPAAKPAANGRIPRLAGSWEVLVVGPGA